MEVWFNIRTLSNQGLGIKSIARQLAISRNTVRKYLNTTEAPKRRPGQRPNQALAPFLADIDALLDKELIGDRILEELRKKGYVGSVRTFYRHLKRLQANRRPVIAVERFETPPGKQAQFDWSQYSVLIGGLLTKVYIFNLILGFSRFRHYFASLEVTQAAIFEALEDSFKHLGGVPRQILFDNPKAIVIRPRPDLIWNPRFLEFAGTYGFTPIACWPYRPQTKGKVENPFRYLEEHFIKANSFLNWLEFTTRLAEFETDVVNVRIHGTTQERPVDRLTLERPELIVLPRHRFISQHEIFRKVSGDCLVAYGGSRYSVPWMYAGKMVWVRSAQGRQVKIFSQDGELLAVHDLSRIKGLPNYLPEHRASLRRHALTQKTVLAEAFTRKYPFARLFVEKLLSQYRYNANHHLQRIANLLATCPEPVVRVAIETALACNTFSWRFIQSYLNEATSGQETPVPVCKQRLIDWPELALQRDLDVYQDLLSEPIS
jgi:transposase